MQPTSPGRIERFETWLTTPRFIAWVVVLVLLNLFVYLWWMNRPDFALHGTAVNSALLQGLESERKELQGLLESSCESDGMLAYRRGERGPLQRPETSPHPDQNPNPPSSTISSPTELVSLLDAATVRVVHEKGTGTGFFINQNTVVTNRHVIEGIGDKPIFVTSKILGQAPLPASLLATSKDSDYGNPDFALLRVENVPSSAKTLAVAVEPSILQPVVAVGYPGQGTASDTDKTTPNAIFTEGQVSVLQPQPNGMVLVVHTANIARGSSGGPLVSRCGHVVGVNTFIVAGKENVDGRSLYALSATSLRNFIEQSNVDYVKALPDCSGSKPGKAD